MRSNHSALPFFICFWQALPALPESQALSGAPNAVNAKRRSCGFSLFRQASISVTVQTTEPPLAGSHDLKTADTTLSRFSSFALSAGVHGGSLLRSDK